MNNVSLLDNANKYFIPQIEPAKNIEQEIKNITEHDLNLPKWNWCGICCLAMILDSLKIKRPKLSEIYKDSFNYQVYRNKNGKIIGAYHKQLANFIKNKYGLKAKAVQG